MRRLALVCATFVVLPMIAIIGSRSISYAQQDARQGAIGFKGFALGGSMSSFKERFPDFKCEGTYCRVDVVRDCVGLRPREGTPEESTKALMACMQRNSYGGVRAKSITAKFIDDSLVSVLVVFTTKLFFDDLSSAMIAGFGEPTRHVREPVQNRMGATFENEKLIWTAAGTTAILSKYGTTVEDGSVYITSDKHLRDVEREQQERRQKGARDL